MKWSQLTQIEFTFAIVCLLLVLGLHMFLHLKKIGTQYLLLRTILLIIGLSGLFLLYSRPTLTTHIDAQNAILITHHAQVINNDHNNYHNIHDFLNDDLNIDTIIIIGDGLSKEDLLLVDSFNIKFIPGEKQKGFIKLHVPVIKEKETWTLRGKINQTNTQRISVEKSNGEIQETTTDEDGNFSMKLKSKHAGHFSYKVNAHYLDSTIIETFPIHVLPSKNWSLLALSAAPSFELNYLKNYWVSLGNGFSLRQKVSDLRYKETFLINAKMDLDVLNRITLSKFNFLMIDASTWNILKSEEQNLTLSFVANGRLGLLFFGLQKGDEVNKIKNFNVVNEEEEVLDKNNGIKLSQINVPEGFRKIESQGLTSAATRSYGLGSIAIMVVNDTYRYILGDQNVAYQNTWAEIFSSLFIAPSENITFRTNAWNWENERTDINIYSQKNINQKGLLNSKTNIDIYKTMGLEGIYHTHIKPTAAGWNTFQLNDHKKTHHFFVHPTNSWQAMKQSHLHNLNIKEAAREKGIPDRQNREGKEVPFYWGLLISILGLGSLWLHERFN